MGASLVMNLYTINKNLIIQTKAVGKGPLQPIMHSIRVYYPTHHKLNMMS